MKGSSTDDDRQSRYLRWGTTTCKRGERARKSSNYGREGEDMYVSRGEIKVRTGKGSSNTFLFYFMPCKFCFGSCLRNALQQVSREGRGRGGGRGP